MTPPTDPFAPILAADPSKPFVIGQLGQSLDGRIATPSGASRDINGEGALDHLHRLRAHVDAVVVGVGTVLADDPRLTVRRVEGRSPARVIIDPRGRLPRDARCLADGGPRTLVVVARAAAKDRADQIGLAPDADGSLDPHAIVAALVARGFRRILVEGGATTVSRFIDADAVDRLHVLVAPVILGSGKPGLSLKPITMLSQAITPATAVYRLSGGDVLFDCDLRRRRDATTRGESE
jgi:diaminohydroxyphosphoribosylaminopyrimidine deaminase / 5-amino-6-(5-phosphoribosylamino)uracil reductase